MSAGERELGYAGDLSPRQAWERVTEGDAVLVDCRTEAEWHYVGVPDLSAAGAEAALIEWVDVQGRLNPDFGRQVAAVAHGRPSVILCRAGHRSVAAAQELTRAGLGPAYNVLEGFEGELDGAGHRGTTGWRAAGLPWRQT